MEELTIILGIVILVFGILQIILFFKLWGMTNDVKAIMKKYTSKRDNSADTQWEIKNAILRGDNLRAKEILTDLYIIRLKFIYNNIVRDDIFGDKIKSLNNVFDAYYKQIGMSLPEQFSKITSRSELDNMFKL